MGAVLAAALTLGAGGSPELPHYTPGDNFTFSDGRTETVTAAGGEVVEWRNDRGFTFRAFRNPVLPRLEWRGEKLRGETTLDAPPDLLWPLVPGAEAEFIARRAVFAADGARRDFLQHWRCRTEAPTTVTVAAGRFEVWPLTCERRDELDAVRQSRHWLYAPTIGHVVLVEDNRDGLLHRRELVAYRKFEPVKAESTVDDPAGAAFQQAMERVLSGFELTWKSADGTHAITYAPVRTFRRDALYCRDFRETETRNGQTETRTGTACRSPDAVWRRFADPGTHLE